MKFIILKYFEGKKENLQSRSKSPQSILQMNEKPHLWICHYEVPRRWREREEYTCPGGDGIAWCAKEHPLTGIGNVQFQKTSAAPSKFQSNLEPSICYAATLPMLSEVTYCNGMGISKTRHQTKDARPKCAGKGS